MQTQIEILNGNVNSHIIGIVMKEAVRRAISAIRHQRFIFESSAKLGLGGNLDDMVTTADKEAQQIYVKILRECFPTCGIVAEEEKLQIACQIDGMDIFFTVDPLDGTKAFVRKQSHGIGTMISLVADGKVVAAFIGDVMSQEIYGFRPNSKKTHRISEYDHTQEICIDPDFKLSDQYVLLRTDPSKHSHAIRRLIVPIENGGIFKGLEVTGGSIGSSMARLWKAEVGAAVLTPGHNTPWDLCPVLGISQHLGFVFMKPQASSWVVFEPKACREIQVLDHDVLIVHNSRLSELSLSD